MNFGEIQTAIRDDLSIDSGDIFYSDAYVKRIARRAIQWVAGFKNWQQTQQAYKFTPIIAGDETDEYWSYPETFKTDSIQLLKYNGVFYDKKGFLEYERYKEEFGASASEKYFSDHRRQYFINPTPTSAAEIIIWGHEVPLDADLEDTTDEHPFNGESEIEEAIVNYAIGMALKKGRGSNYNKGVQAQNEATAALNRIFEQQKKEQAKYGSIQAEMFTPIEIIPETSTRVMRTRRGNFKLDF